MQIVLDQSVSVYTHVALDVSITHCYVLDRSVSQYLSFHYYVLDQSVTIYLSFHNMCVLCIRSECFPIPIMPGDERFQEPCMNFVRSIAGHSDDCNMGKMTHNV